MGRSAYDSIESAKAGEQARFLWQWTAAMPSRSLSRGVIVIGPNERDVVFAPADQSAHPSPFSKEVWVDAATELGSIDQGPWTCWVRQSTSWSRSLQKPVIQLI